MPMLELAIFRHVNTKRPHRKLVAAMSAGSGYLPGNYLPEIRGKRNQNCKFRLLKYNSCCFVGILQFESPSDLPQPPFQNKSANNSATCVSRSPVPLESLFKTRSYRIRT